jgi:hypothetical protein
MQQRCSGVKLGRQLRLPARPESSTIGLMATDSMSLRDMLFWVFLTLFGTGTYVIYGSQSFAGEVCGVAMIIVGLVGMIACAWPHLKRWLPWIKKGEEEHGSAAKKDEPAQPESGAGDAAKTIVKAGPPITLKQLFEIDWQNLPAFYNECVLSSQIFDSRSVKVAWRVNGDFVGRSKFLAILIDPATTVSDAFRTCEAIADQYGHFIDSPNSEVDIQGQAPDDTAPTHLKDMVFSKRIFIYYEDFSLVQKGILETTYHSKELAVQFRDAAYAWAHRNDKPRATPLVPNSTILPNAKLTPGLRITITKLSPGVDGEKTKIGAANVAEPNVTFDDAKISIQKVVEDRGRFRLFVPNETAKFLLALTVEVRNHAVDGNPIASAGQVKAQLKCILAQGTYDIAPGAWLDEPYSSVRLDVGDTRRLILAVGVDWIHDWRMVTNKRTGPSDAVMLDYSRGFPMSAKGTIEASIIGSGRILRKLKIRVQWEHNHSLWMQPIQEGKP